MRLNRYSRVEFINSGRYSLYYIAGADELLPGRPAGDLLNKDA